MPEHGGGFYYYLDDMLGIEAANAALLSQQIVRHARRWLANLAPVAKSAVISTITPHVSVPLFQYVDTAIRASSRTVPGRIARPRFLIFPRPQSREIPLSSATPVAKQTISIIDTGNRLLGAKGWAVCAH
jgi:hypothetical protein